MKINSINSDNTNFKSIISIDSKTCSKILEGLKEKDLLGLKDILIKEQSNPVNALVKMDKNKLTAKLECQYRLKNFKANYSQVPFFESNISFIKRIAKKCDEYKSQLVDIL